MEVLEGGVVSYERGTPVISPEQTRAHEKVGILLSA